jgi:cell division protein FtsB
MHHAIAGDKLNSRTMADTGDLAAPEIRKVELEIKKLKSETGKLRAETRKLEAEAILLKRRWFVHPQYVSVIVPMFALFCTALIACYNSEYRRESQDLKKEAVTLREQNVTLQSERAALSEERDRIAQDVRVLQPKEKELRTRIQVHNDKISTWREQLLDISTRLKSKSFGGGGIQIFPPPNAEPERKLLQGIIDSMLSTLGPREVQPVAPNRK